VGRENIPRTTFVCPNPVPGIPWFTIHTHEGNTAGIWVHVQRTVFLRHQEAGGCMVSLDIVAPSDPPVKRNTKKPPGNLIYLRPADIGPPEPYDFETRPGST
jgi:hypothetical protein